MFLKDKGEAMESLPFLAGCKTPVFLKAVFKNQRAEVERNG